ncbi:uncharacterized protein LOC110991259 isoform X2 [Acanthaster planci]|uniref:Uncharacterized protein LOC110991259 isoform X2 n=1 Tax=Acanthaster planci TaxID=133434 RepID=A0A8B8A3G4_ACAPL|nr:uncharacterized protein LOC110991259 isoform X2 [Acanthaster planci]
MGSNLARFIQGYPDAALEDCRSALKVDPNSERASWQEVLARFDIIKQEFHRNKNLDIMIGFEVLLSEKPEKILEHPKVKEVIKELNLILDPHKELNHVRRRPKVKSSQNASSRAQNGVAAGGVAMEWVPDHVKANKKTNQKAKASTKNKKKNKTKPLVRELSSEEEESCEESSYESDASSISTRGTRSDSTRKQTCSAATSSNSRSYGLDDFGPIQLPSKSQSNGATPKATSSGPPPEPPGRRASNELLPTRLPPAIVDYANLYCKVCNMQSNAHKQLLQHLAGAKHMAKQAEFMRTQQGHQSAGVQRAPFKPPPAQRVPAQPQHFTLPTKNTYASLSSPDIQGPRPTMLKSPMAPAANQIHPGLPRPATAASVSARAGNIVPHPKISPQSMEWLKKFTFRLACEKCFPTIAGKFGYKGHRYQPHDNHHCYGGWLICRLGSLSHPSEEIWGKIRCRTKPDFMGPYSLCQQFDSGNPCKVGEDNCWYCHSREELMIWDADRAGSFKGKEIVNFLRYSQGIGVKQPKEEPKQDQSGFTVVSHQGSNRAKPVQPYPGTGMGASKMAPIAVPNAAKAVLPEQPKKKPPVDESLRKWHLMLMARVGGHFLYLCGRCFDGAPPVMALRSPTTPFCSNEEGPHPWEQSKVLVHIFNEKGKARYQKVRPKPKGIPARAYLCYNIQKRFGCRFGDSCKFAHNLIEIEVWEFEVLYSLMRDTIVQLCSEAASRQPAQAPQPPASSAPGPTPKAAPPASQPLPTPSVSQAIPKFNHNIQYVCGLCFSRTNQCVGQNPRKRDNCAGSNPHPWQHKIVVVYSVARKRFFPVKPRHPNLRREIHPILCKHLDKCYRAECMFPHCEEESSLWRYMAQYNREYLVSLMRW